MALSQNAIKNNSN